MADARALPGLRRVLPSLLPLAGLLALWQVAKMTGVLPMTVPAPHEVWGALATSGSDLVYHAEATVTAALAGYAIALAIAVLLGGIAVAIPATERSVFTLGIFIDSTPLIAVAPILMIWLGNGATLHVVVAAVGALFPLLVGMIQGFKSTTPDMRELFHVLSASPLQRLRYLALPQSLPYVFAALKVAAPLALLGTLIAEWMGTDRGLGTLIVYALFSFNVPLVWLSILTVSAITAAAYGLVALAESRIVTWKRPLQAGRET